MNKKFLLVVSTIPILLLAGSLAMGATTTLTNTLSTSGLALEVTDGSIEWGSISEGNFWNSLNTSDDQVVHNMSLGIPTVEFAYSMGDFTDGPNTLVNAEGLVLAADEFSMEMDVTGTAAEGEFDDVITYTPTVIDTGVVPDASLSKTFRLTLGPTISFVSSDLTADIEIVVTAQ